jgi:hypothetical protein
VLERAGRSASHLQTQFGKLRFTTGHFLPDAPIPDVATCCGGLTAKTSSTNRVFAGPGRQQVGASTKLSGSVNCATLQAEVKQEGIIRASYRESDRNPSPIEPGQVYEYGIDLWAASYVVKAGHQIRVEISSSNLNRFDRNPNTGEPFGMATDPITAHQQIFHTTEYPSRITLPINLGEPHPNLNACQTERRLK